MNDLFGEKKIMALSWKEPFASLMLHGKIETRTWNTKYRGLVLICASKTIYSENVLDQIAGNQKYRIIETLRPINIENNCGKAIAVGELINCRPMTREDMNDCFVKYSPFLFCHIYKNVHAIKPFDWKGTQGWKQLTKEEVNKIEYIH